MLFQCEILSPRLREHIKYCHEHDYESEIPVGEIIAKEDILRGAYTTSCFFSKINRKVNSERLHIKSAGTYATLHARGSYDMIPEVCQKILEHLEKIHKTALGDFYEKDLLNFISVSDQNEYLLKISIQIRS